MTLNMTEKEKYKKRNAFNYSVIILLLLLIVVSLIIAVSLGASGVSFIKALKIIFSGGAVEGQGLAGRIVLSIRLPRAVAAICAGIALASAGLLMQGIFQNPLVSPYTLGVSNGAAFGASIAIVMRGAIAARYPAIAEYALPFFAFVFSSLSMLIVYLVSKVKKHDTKTLILAGVAIGYLFSALVSSVRYFSDVRELPELIFWTMGGLSGINWNAIIIIAVVVLIGIVFMLYFAWDLNALAAGEETAVSLGVNYKRIKVLAFVLSTLMTSAAVSFTGVIGFVGLIAPHIAKMIVGSDYRFSIPASAFMGALLLLVSDTIARLLIAPSEIPVGVITSFIGVPFFLYLILRNRKN